jgi:hypothetical protein
MHVVPLYCEYQAGPAPSQHVAHRSYELVRFDDLYNALVFSMFVVWPLLNLHNTTSCPSLDWAHACYTHAPIIHSWPCVCGCVWVGGSVIMYVGGKFAKHLKKLQSKEIV